MKFNRTKNASRNIVFGLLQRIYQLIIPFVIRTAMIYCLGVEYLGLDGLFSSVLSVLNLAELGVGSAMVYSMYKPVAEDDKTRICALMKLYRTYYRIIGLIVLLGGLVICPFIPKLISGNIPQGLNIYVLFLLNLAATVCSYWLFAYKNSILQAHQRVDVISKVTMAVNTVRYVIQILLLFVFKDYYLYLIVALLAQLGINISTAYMSEKLFPGYKAEGQINPKDKQVINHRIRDLFTAKIGAVIVDSVDTLVISAFLGLTVLAIYQNYFYILTALITIIGVILSSCIAGIGNSLIVESREKNFKDLQLFTFIIVCIAGYCSSCLISLYQPFMELWVGKEYMFSISVVACFVVYFFIKQINTLLNVYKDAAGMWHEDRFRPLVTALSNLVMNLIMVRFWGIYGVLLSTILSMLFIGIPWILMNLFTVIFDKKYLLGYVRQLLYYSVVVTLCIVLSFLVSNLFQGTLIMKLIFGLMTSTIITMSLFFLFFRKRSELKESIQLFNRMTKGKLSFLFKWFKEGTLC